LHGDRSEPVWAMPISGLPPRSSPTVRPKLRSFEFPCHPIQETGKRPTASLDRNLAYLSLVEVLYGAGLGDADQRLAAAQLADGQAEIEVALEVERGHAFLHRPGP
jgi:hypothetical protein